MVNTLKSIYPAHGFILAFLLSLLQLACEADPAGELAPPDPLPMTRDASVNGGSLPSSIDQAIAGEMTPVMGGAEGGAEVMAGEVMAGEVMAGGLVGGAPVGGEQAGEGAGGDETPVAIRYIRVSTTESPSWVSWFEIEVLAPDDESGELTNWALTATSTASTTEEGSSVEAVHDGDETTSWNAGQFAPAHVDLDLGRLLLVSAVRLKVAQNPSGQTTHTLEGSQDGVTYRLLETFQGYTSSRDWLVYRSIPTTVATGECSPLELNLIMRQLEQPTSDSSIWFWGMGVPEQRPRLEVDYRDETGEHTATFQAGPRGTHGDLWASRILGENPYWGPGSCPVTDPECPFMFLHHFQARGTVDGAPLWHGILRGDLSVISCDAEILRAHLHLHINEDEGLANADHTSTVAIHRGLRRWNPNLVNGRRYDRDPITGTDLLWTTPGGDFGEYVMGLEAQRDFWDRGFHKANPRAWFDITPHLIELQGERVPF